MKFSYELLKNITSAKPLWECNLAGEFELSTDTRKISKGQVYIPLKGESFNGENFINNALENGAEGYFTTDFKNINKKAKFVLLVEDTKIAYMQLASYYKSLVNPTTIAITGSSGKTTTKEIFGAIFENNRKTHKSMLNHNNEIGLCQTLLSMPTDTEVLIVEMGMRALGEIDLLSKYARPDFAVITNIGTAHIGILKTRENIAKAKCEIVNYFSENAMLVTGFDELYKDALKNFDKKHVIADVSSAEFSFVEMTKNCSSFVYKDFEYKLYAGGEYNVKDAILAIEVALAYGLTPEQIQIGLSCYKSIENRFEEVDVNGLKFINDSYNANPDSMKAAIKAFVELHEGDKVLVLGDMRELGDNSVIYHREIGDFVNKFENIEIITVGELAKNISDITKHKSHHFDTNKQVADYLRMLNKNKRIFLKGSHSMNLVEIIEEIRK